MAKRTPEEIRAQREAFLAAKAARAAGLSTPAPPALAEKPAEPAPAQHGVEPLAAANKPQLAEKK